MDYLSPLSINIETVNISNIVILPNKLAGDLYFDEIYDNFVDIFVYTCDGSYPENSALKEKLEYELKNNDKLNIIVFGAKHILEKSIKSKKILILDDLIIPDFSNKRIDKLNSLNLDAYKVSCIIKSFCSQDKKMKIGNNLDEVLNHKEYNPEKFNTFYSLITGNSID
jgi:hypothetical protein